MCSMISEGRSEVANELLDAMEIHRSKFRILKRKKKRIRLSFAVYTGSPASSLQGSLYGSLGTGRDVHLIVGRKPTNLRVSFGARAAQLQGSGLRLRSHAGPCALASLIVSAHQLFFDPKR